MDYIGTIIRPPSEASSIILQVTLGCSHNKCTFCPAYKDKPFRLKKFSTIMNDLEEAAHCFPNTRRLFLCDGDVLILSQAKLVKILEAIQRKLPRINRVGIYANTKSILRKDLSELEELKQLNLGIIYHGIESGDGYVDNLHPADGPVARTRFDEDGRIRPDADPLAVQLHEGVLAFGYASDGSVRFHVVHAEVRGHPESTGVFGIHHDPVDEGNPVKPPRFVRLIGICRGMCADNGDDGEKKQARNSFHGFSVQCLITSRTLRAQPFDERKNALIE